MAREPFQYAEERLKALAEARRAVAGALPPLSDVGRRRLQEEVRRVNEGAASIREPELKALGWRDYLRASLAWLGVAAAFGVLLWVVFLPSGPSRVATNETAAREVPGNSPVDSPAPPAGGGAPLAKSADLAEAIPAPAGVAAVAPVDAAQTPATAEGAARFDFAAAQKVRQLYRAVVVGGRTPPILKSFEILRTGGAIQIRDEDGSVFEGRLPVRAPTQDLNPAWTFEARGASRALGKTIQITGNFGRTLDATAPTVARDTDPARDATEVAGMPPYLRQPFWATILVDDASVIEIQAVPVVEP